jgi:integrase
VKRRDSSTKAVEVGDSITRFLEYCRGKGLQPSTINRSYALALQKKLLPFCQREGVRTLDQLTPAMLSRFTAELHATKLSKWSIAAYVRSVNRFLAWTGRRDPAEKAPRPQTKRVHRDVLTLAEMRRLEEAAQTVRNQLIIRVLADTGCRISELAHIEVGDVVKRGREWYVRISGKTGERMPPISEEVFDRLRKFALNGRGHATSERLFLSAHRDPRTGQYEPLKADGAYQVVKDVAELTKWNRRVYPHLLRHSWITHMEAKHVDPAVIAEVAGVSIEVIVKNYSHLSDRDRHNEIMRALLEP